MFAFSFTSVAQCGNCDDPQNFPEDAPGLGYFIHDFILINSNSGETWTIQSPEQVVDNSENIIPAGTVIPAVAPGSGIYYLDIWYNATEGGWTADATNGSFTLSTGPGVDITCPPCPNAPLPVELIDFKAAINNAQQVELSWLTGFEMNNSHFEIEKSLDGNRFNFVGKQEGEGTTTVTSHYRFTDTKTAVGKTYYRLKQVDFDGEYKYSEIVSVKIKSDQVIVNIAPNPVKDRTVIRLGAESIINTSLELRSITGQIIRVFKLSDNSTFLEIDMSGLSEGIYFLSMANDTLEQKTFHKVVKF